MFSYWNQWDIEAFNFGWIVPIILHAKHIAPTKSKSYTVCVKLQFTP